jgi:uncharacterized membrane protein
VSDTISWWAGSSGSLILHTLWFGGWIVVNAGVGHGVTPFDPFPFSLLTMVVSLEAIFLSLFILISQNRLSRQTERRDQLGLQVNLLSEQESTVTLRLLLRLCEHMGVDPGAIDAEIGELSKSTSVRRLVNELDQKLPNT